MVFSDFLFIFGFFPLFLLLYRIVPRILKNILILISSLFFYWIGEGEGVWLLVAVIVWNYVIALWIDHVAPGVNQGNERSKASKLWLVIGVTGNLLSLAYFKYAGFFTQSINDAGSFFGIGNHIVPVLHVALPLGVSFFVFQGVSYLVDVYRREIAATRSLINFATYKSMFPQLVAGPIVRYSHVASELVQRKVTDDMRLQGIRRFVIGFAKKVLLADTFAVVADGVFAIPSAELTTSLAWAGAVAYSLQIYFDFSAYSDMAIGIGMMMGFKFPENFNYPYTARSIKDFWRRWHMTLSTWFRDYVYIPLGGNRKGTARMYLNMLTVFFLTGLWHGAAWTFVVWGLWHGLFLVFERVVDLEQRKIPVVCVRAYTLLVVIVGWVLFRSTDFPYAFNMLKAMAGLGDGDRELIEFVDWLIGLSAVVAVLFSTPLYQRVINLIPDRIRLSVGFLLFSLLFLLSSIKILSGAYSPFLYFRF